jgi:hypothetical protein
MAAGLNAALHQAVSAARDEVGARLAAESAAGSFESLVRPVATAIDAVVTHFEVSGRHCPGDGACNVSLDVEYNLTRGVAFDVTRAIARGVILRQSV